MSTLAKPVSHGPSSAADYAESRPFGPPFWASLGLHVLAVVLIVGLTVAVKDQLDDQPAVFELVAGEGDDFMATEAPAGHEAGQAKTGEIAFTAPESVPTWTPPAPAPAAAEPTPVAPVPVSAPAVTAAKAEPKPNFTQNIKSTLRQEKRKVDREIKQQRAADAAAAKAAAAAEAKRTSFEQFQKQNPAKPLSAKTPAKTTGAASSAAATTPGPRIDAGGIKRGVTGAIGAGSTGAGGTALARAEANAMEAYFAMLIQRLRDGHEKPAGLSDLLNAEVQFTVAANGAIAGVRILRSSGNADFDRSVLEAFGRAKMPARPDKNTDVQRLTFRIKEV